MSRADEREEARAEVLARLKNYNLSSCLDCGGQGYTDMGKSACFWCRGAGVITQQMAYAFGMADRAEAAAAQHKWKPISTAPKDREIMAGKWHGASWARDITRWDGDGWWQMRQIPPTHWCEIQMPHPPASGIDARSDETRSGSAEGESPIGNAETPTHTPEA